MTLRTRNKLIAPKLTREMVEQLSAAKNEPAWLLNARLTAWELYDTLNMPSLQSEAWRRTDYTTIRWEQAGKIVYGGSAGIEAIPAENL
ncbi:MAG: hypothetical protein ACK4P1_12275, partial [Aggregatilineales bacterium]